MIDAVALRRADERDLPALIELWQAVFGDDEAFIRAFYDASDIRRTLVALHGEQIVGMINCPKIELWSHSAHGEMRYRGAYIYALAVDARHRSEGIGSALLKAAEDGVYLSEAPQFLLLIPAEASLFAFYRQKGYDRMAFAPQTESIAQSRTALAPLELRSDELYSRYLAACEKEAARGAVFVKPQALFALSMNGTDCYRSADGYIALNQNGAPSEVRPALPDLTCEKALWKALTDITDANSPLISRFMED